MPFPVTQPATKQATNVHHPVLGHPIPPRGTDPTSLFQHQLHRTVWWPGPASLNMYNLQPTDLGSAPPLLLSSLLSQSPSFGPLFPVHSSFQNFPLGPLGKHQIKYWLKPKSAKVSSWFLHRLLLLTSEFSKWFLFSFLSQF